MANIFLLEDDTYLSHGIKAALEKDSHTVIQAFGCIEGTQIMNTQQVDILILDIRLPDGNGIQFCRQIRQQHNHPVIFLTANDTEEDMLAGYEAGCDDYVTKPFSLEVIRRKVNALAKRMDAATESKKLFQYKALSVFFPKKEVTLNGQHCKLTATEYKLLEHLIQNQGMVVTREMLLDAIWDIDGNFIDENTLSVHIRRLRSKIEENPKKPVYILTVFGIGYTFGDDNE